MLHRLGLTELGEKAVRITIVLDGLRRRGTPRPGASEAVSKPKSDQGLTQGISRPREGQEPKADPPTAGL